MTLLLYALLALVFWWLCGVFNVALVYFIADDPENEFTYHNRTSTYWWSLLGLCFAAGPCLTAACLIVAAGYYPIKFGTRIGRALGRRLFL